MKKMSPSTVTVLASLGIYLVGTQIYAARERRELERRHGPCTHPGPIPRGGTIVPWSYFQRLSAYERREDAIRVKSWHWPAALLSDLVDAIVK